MEGSERVATCSCGQLKISCSGDPVRISLCHCLACQKRTGSAFAVQARFPRERTRIEGRASTWTRTGDEGGQATFSFCPDCAAIVHYVIVGHEGVVAVPVGAFADPQFPGPKTSVYESRRHPWVHVEVEEVHD